MKSLFKFRITLPLVAMLGAVLATANGSLAQSFDGTWFAIDGGGGLSVGGSYSLAGSVSPSDAGTITGGSYALTGSYWSAPGELSVGDPPRLEMIRTTGGLVLRWPFPSEGWSLEQTSELGQSSGGTVWSNTTLPLPERDGSLWKVTIPATAGHSFFRLHFP